MATRIEKIFRLSTVKAMNSILNEVNTFIEVQNNSKRTKKSKDNLAEEAMLYSHIWMHSAMMLILRSICPIMPTSMR